MLCVKQETAYDVRISDWSSDVCSSDLLVLLAVQVRGWNRQIIEEQFGRRMVAHRADGADRQAVALRLAHVDEQHAHPVGGLGTILARGGAAEEDHQVRMFGAADPDLLAVDNIFVADLTRKGADARRVSARGRFGDAEGLKAEFSARDRGQIDRKSTRLN